MLMTGPAEMWVNELPAQVRDDYEALTAAFIAYFENADLVWILEQELSERKQGADESVEDYSANIKSRCARFQTLPNGIKQCRSTQFIPISSWCDGYGDCNDRSDEGFCDYVCSDDQFQCKGGWCVDFDKLCNGWNDCGDKSDEVNCTEFCPGEYKCKAGIFSNGNTLPKCIPLHLRCDMFIDCDGGDDEHNCEYVLDPFRDIDVFADPHWFEYFYDITQDSKLFDDFKDKYYTNTTTSMIPNREPLSLRHVILASAFDPALDIWSILDVPVEELTMYGHQREDMILKCRYQQNKCQASRYSYSMTTSLAVWPSDDYSNRLLHLLHVMNNKTKSINTSTLRGNIALVHVYIDSLHIETVSQEKAYDVIDLFADIGGALGLWIGMSAVTLFEVIELILSILTIWNVAHNINKREKIIDQLRLKFENKYSEKEYQFAVRRAYENQRIRAKEAANMTLKTKNTKNKRSHTLRWQTMKRRGRVVEERRREPYGKKYNLN
uniref:Uncharacterized protein LOC102804014 n=1 Tax=Saccoglossus kowalevskii TaxID=10224 RepID=A0ABM0MF58_SACKO|nr:PREDICTED: uncharacterized protein LOC102804014 [Saccoglossus kowalevskii]